jgi:hypothetical protein
MYVHVTPLVTLQYRYYSPVSAVSGSRLVNVTVTCVHIP